MMKKRKWTMQRYISLQGKWKEERWRKSHHKSVCTLLLEQITTTGLSPLFRQSTTCALLLTEALSLVKVLTVNNSFPTDTRQWQEVLCIFSKRVYHSADLAEGSCFSVALLIHWNSICASYSVRRNVINMPADVCLLLVLCWHKNTYGRTHC